MRIRRWAGVETEILVRFRLTPEELWQGQKLHLQQRFTRRRVWCFFLAAVFFCLAELMMTNFEESRFLPILVVAAIVPWILKWVLQRQNARRPDLTGDLEWLITPESLQFRNGNSESRLQWSAIVKAILTPRGFLLFPNDQFFYWLPRSGIRDEQDFAKLAKWVADQVPRLIRAE